MAPDGSGGEVGDHLRANQMRKSVQSRAWDAGAWILASDSTEKWLPVNLASRYLWIQEDPKQRRPGSAIDSKTLTQPPGFYIELNSSLHYR